MKSYFDEMKYALAGVLLLVCLGAFAVFNLITQPESADISAGPLPQTVYAKTGNIFDAFFTEPFETMVILARDGTFYTFTTQYDRTIAIPPSYIHEYLLKQNIEPKDISIIIHNHPAPSGFSDADNVFFRYFKRQGFQGSFCIYYPFSKSVLVKED